MISRAVVYWLNPSGLWQQAYDGNETGAHVIAGAYEARGASVGAWLYDDTSGWRWETWNDVGDVRGAPPEPREGPSIGAILAWGLVGALVGGGVAAGVSAASTGDVSGKWTGGVAALGAVAAGVVYAGVAGSRATLPPRRSDLSIAITQGMPPVSLRVGETLTLNAPGTVFASQSSDPAIVASLGFEPISATFKGAAPGAANAIVGYTDEQKMVQHASVKVVVT